MKLWLTTGLALVALILAGCGTAEPSMEEVNRAYSQGLRTGRIKARAAAEDEAYAARVSGYEEGLEEGEGSDTAFELEEKEAEVEELEDVIEENESTIRELEFQFSNLCIEVNAIC